MQGNSSLKIKKIVLIALITAVLSAGKFALMAIPNIEVVTLIIVAGTFVFGPSVLLPATLIFSAIETSIWGFNSWVISYFIYWPLLSLVVYFMKGLINRNKVVFPSVIAFIMTLFFGVLTTLVDSFFYSSSAGFWDFFRAKYILGIYFFLVQTVSNTIVLALIFVPFSKVLTRLKDKYYSNWKRKIGGNIDLSEINNESVEEANNGAELDKPENELERKEPNKESELDKPENELERKEPNYGVELDESEKEPVREEYLAQNEQEKERKVVKLEDNN